MGIWWRGLTATDSISISIFNRRWSSSVGIATGYELEGRGTIPYVGQSFSLLRSGQIGSGAHAVSCPKGTGRSFPGVKRLDNEADHSATSRAEVKNGGAIPPLSQICSWPSAELINQRDNNNKKFSFVSEYRTEYDK
jgi:hypothetical protein